MVKKLLIALLLLNIFDGVATYFGLHFQLIKEGNPLMESLYETSPALFLLFKLGISILLLFFIQNNLKLKSAILKGVCLTAVCVYSMVNILHMYWIYYYIT
ncbi:hypothetical protein FZC76_10045 [Sutcliffiella horikoshii]|uniref:DUF5658 domain-containing protein n=1 Tax=Sutcliffiella horikoshii TaxID=79883 RepID=A0A5D4SXP8_9BACI|nr:DUF5658 family protein [Sutcliffiella horikoshii]TYS68085.1 hypothetical protein FZC76_10045 [Sutcliffiella horikoshii]